MFVLERETNLISEAKLSDASFYDISRVVTFSFRGSGVRILEVFVCKKLENDL